MIHSIGSSIYDLLSTDHAIILTALDTVEKITDPDRRKRIFSFIRTELVMHSKAEEEVFYRPLSKILKQNQTNEQHHNLLHTSFEDHQEIERLLVEIQLSSARNELWIEKIRKLRSMIQHHVMKEETDLFSLAKKTFSSEDAENIAIRMIEEKGKLGMENPFTIIRQKMKDMLVGI